MLDEQHAGRAAVDEARQKQRVGPDRESDQHAADRAARRGAPPDQAAEKRRRELCDRGERQQADGRELRGAERLEIQIRHDHDGEDRDPADFEHEVAEVLACAARSQIARQHQRHDQIVGHHDCERHAFDDHHGGGRRQSADEDDNAEQRGFAFDGQRQHVHVTVDDAERERHQPGQSDRNHEQVDGDQIKRKQPACAADFGVARILYHADVELPRQQHDGEKRQQHHGEEIADRRRVIDRAHRFRRFHRAFEQLGRAEHPERHENADGEKREQLDDRFSRHRQHQAVLVLGCVGMPRSEQHRKGRHRQRHHERDIADQRHAGDGVILAHDGFERRADRLQLQRDVGHRPDDGDDRHRCGDRLALAVTGRDEVGDRGDVLRFRQLNDPSQQRRTEHDQDHRADIDGQEVDAVAGGETDRAEKRPRRAVDRQR